jgi:hypothetical protein
MGGGRRDPYGGTIEVNVDSPRDDAAVHHGRGGSRPSNPPPPPPTVTRGCDRDFRLFKQWFPWLIPTFVFANIVVFIVTMYVNDCPKNSFSDTCVASFLGRFSFQPLKENPLFGPSSST